MRKNRNRRQRKRDIERRNLCVDRQAGYCCWCKRQFSEDRPATLDHILPLAIGGPDELDNLAAACEPCNLKRSRDFNRYWLKGVGYEPRQAPLENEY